MELYILSNNKVYLESAEIFLANIIRNCAIWNMKYGNAKERESFFSLFPLKEAPYIAAFEEHETAAIFHRITRFVHKHKIGLNAALHFFLNEYIQYTLIRFPFYFPQSLPKHVFADESKTGYVNTDIWIPIEDLGDGWAAVGLVGQEVYGSAVFFNLCLHHIVQLPNDNYAISSLPFIQNKTAIDILGQDGHKGILWIKKKDVAPIEINGKRQKLKKQYLINAKDNIQFTEKITL